MEATVTSAFRDKGTKRVYEPGDAYSGTAARVTELAGMGFVEARRPEPEEEPEPEDEV